MKKELIILITLLVVLLSGCNNISPEPIQPIEELSVGVYINNSTKASYNKTSFANDDAMSVWVTVNRADVMNKLETTANYADNNKFLYNSSASRLSPSGAKITFPTPNSRLGVYCVYPYNANYSLISDANKTILEHSVATDQTTTANYNASDLMTGSRGFSGYSAADMAAPGAISMYHRMARLDITVSVPKNYGNAPFVGDSYLKLHGQNITSKVQMSVTAEDATANPNTTMPAATSGSNTASIQMHKYDENTTAEPRLLKFEAIIVPQTIASGLTMIEFCGRFTESTEVLKYFYYTSGEAIKFEAGKSYSLQLSIANMKPITFNDVTITDWNASTSSGGLEE